MEAAFTHSATKKLDDAFIDRPVHSSIDQSHHVIGRTRTADTARDALDLALHRNLIAKRNEILAGDLRDGRVGTFPLRNLLLYPAELRGQSVVAV